MIETRPSSGESTSPVVAAVSALVLLTAVVVLVASAVRTTSASVSASTDAVGFFSAGTISLESATARQQFLFDATGLFPGERREGCVEIDYVGTIPGDVRLFAEPATSTGLDRFIQLDFDVITSGGGCNDRPTASTPSFAGGLDEFWQRHSSYETGWPVAAAIESETRLAIRATVELVDDNAAQGLMIDFSMIVEVRP